MRKVDIAISWLPDAVDVLIDLEDGDRSDLAKAIVEEGRKRLQGQPGINRFVRVAVKGSRRRRLETVQKLYLGDKLLLPKYPGRSVSSGIVHTTC